MNRISTRSCNAILWIVVLTIFSGSGVTSCADDAPSFSRDIQPLLAKHCVLCHGPDEAEAGLRLDVQSRAVEKLESGLHAIVPGKSNESELLRRVTSDDADERMPPEGDPLTTTEVELLRNWIDHGAVFEVHWSYRPVQQPAIPDVMNTSWVRNPIDNFILAKLEQEHVAPSPEASPATLVKRLYYDLIGLPPSPQDVDAFLADTTDAAYESLVDRLLGSEHFGERWGRHWLDKARYADSDGYEKDRPRLNAWRYRDWVIEAINRDMPFDQFTIEQLAGDLLPDASPAQKLATAFHRQTLTNTEGGTDQEEFRVEATFDRTETTSSVWMALTMTCARCHSHKYDQITQKEYYQLFSFFNNANEGNLEIARSEEAMQKYLRDKEIHDAKVASLTQKYVAAQQKLQPQIDRWANEMSALLTAEEQAPVEFQTATLVSAKAASKATLEAQSDGSFLVTGPVSDKDEYTLIFELPESPLTGLRLEVLTDDSLANKGPGRAPNGNFVLSELRAYLSDDREFKKHSRIEFINAEADHAQDSFSPDGALFILEKTGWAISPKMGESHQWTAYTAAPIEAGEKKFLQVVIDQQYGGQHTIGRFRISTMSGFDPRRALPILVAKAVTVEANNRSQQQQQVIADHVASLHQETATLTAEIEALKEKTPPSPMMTVRVIAPAQRTTKVLHRGDFLQPEDEVKSNAMAIIGRSHPLRPREADQPIDRLDLARWLVDQNHPLTPRVSVNQVWAHLFGRGIVTTLNDFGVRGEQPTHPQLLDWLAWRYPRDLGWSRKALIKLIVMSATYRQSSHHRPDLEKKDPTNQLLARQNRVRVSAEVVRDLYLAVGGLLSNKVGGPSVFPPLPAGVAELSYANNFKWNTSQGEDAYRRGMYTFFKRTSPHPTLISFDCPDSNTTRLARETSNTPLQALVTLNNDVFTEAAQALTQRVITEAGTDDRQRLAFALRLCIVREPDSEEVDLFMDLLNTSRDYYQTHPEEAKQLSQRHPAKDIATVENAAWIATLRMVLNLDEFIVRD